MINDLHRNSVVNRFGSKTAAQLPSLAACVVSSSGNQIARPNHGSWWVLAPMPAAIVAKRGKGKEERGRKKKGGGEEEKRGITVEIMEVESLAPVVGLSSKIYQIPPYNRPLSIGWTAENSAYPDRTLQLSGVCTPKQNACQCSNQLSRAAKRAVRVPR